MVLLGNTSSTEVEDWWGKVKTLREVKQEKKQYTTDKQWTILLLGEMQNFLFSRDVANWE